MPVWGEHFESPVRRRLPNLAANDALLADTQPRDLGIDSLNMVSLLDELEDGYGVTTDEALTAETFATPRPLWRAPPTESVKVVDANGS